MSITVRYEDNHIIAALKPAGVLAQADLPAGRQVKQGSTDMLTQVKKYLKKKYKKPGNVFVGLLHRLDRPVSGVMIFAKTSKGAARLSEQFRNRQVQKTYQALVTGKPAMSKGVLTNKLGKDEKLKKAKEYADGQETFLQYEVIASSETYSLLKIHIDGGKFHQIRAQLSLAGMPIVGDVKYGGEKWPDEKAIALCATELIFRAATTDEVITVSTPIPETWKTYSQLGY